MIETTSQFAHRRADELELAHISFARANADCLNKKAPKEWGALQLALRHAKRNFELARRLLPG